MLNLFKRAPLVAALALTLFQLAPASFAGDRWINYGFFHPVGCGTWYPYSSCGRDIDLDSALGAISTGDYHCTACKHSLAEAAEPLAPSDNEAERSIKYTQRTLEDLH